MRVSWNRGTPQSSISMAFSLINQLLRGNPHDYGNPHMGTTYGYHIWVAMTHDRWSDGYHWAGGHHPRAISSSASGLLHLYTPRWNMVMLKHHHENIRKHTKTYKNIQKHTKTCYWAAIFSYQDLIKTHLKNPKPMQLWKLCNSESPLLNALEIDILELDLLSAQSLFPVKNFSDYNWIHVITIYYNGILQTLQTLQTPD